MAKRDDWRTLNLEAVRRKEEPIPRFWSQSVGVALTRKGQDEADVFRWLDDETPRAADRAFSLLERELVLVQGLAWSLFERQSIRYDGPAKGALMSQPIC